MAKDPGNSISSPFARKPRDVKSHETINCCLNERWMQVVIKSEYLVLGLCSR